MKHVVLLFLFAAHAHAATNLLRNGSFEGGLLYWHGIDTNKHTLVRGDAKAGEFALRIEKSYVMSAPFVAQPGAQVTVSFWVKAEQPGEVRVQMPPSAREPGQKSRRLWAREGTKSAKVGTDWQRVSFTWPANVPQEGFWPNPHYMLLIEATKPILVDGVTVGSADWVPRREIEIIADCPDLPGYEGAKANLFERDATVHITAHATNPGTEPRDITIRWQLIDYEGTRVINEPVDKKVTIAAGKTVSETVPLKLTHTGCVIARVSVISNLQSEIDRSDFPLTSLPYPKSATRPNWREKFGGSFAGGIGCVQKFQRLGFGWIRWRPHMNGQDHWPKQDDPMRFFDKELDEQEAHGCSTHCVLYPPPNWIMEKGSPLPKDMRWPANDPRWDDLTIETVWDKFVKAAVTHYKGRSLVFEIENEPELDHWDKLKDEYAQFTIRTARLIKQTNPQAKVMVDNVYGIPSAINRHLLEKGGGKFIDIISWHDYHEGWLADATAMRRMRQNLDAIGGKHIEIWFNEGWAFTNTLVDEPPACTHLTSAQSCNAIMASVAELTANGQDKTILFHTAYEKHGMSFWDYSGPGTMLWDWYNFPLPIAAAWNVLAHHIGFSKPVAFIRPPGANLCIFDDLRNNRGVIIAYADRDAKTDATVELPFTDLTLEDIMGNAAPAPKTLTLSKTGRPVILYSKVSGKTFADKLAALDRKHASFVTGATYRLPATWEKDNPAVADGKPIWRLDQLWPDNPVMAENYIPLPWSGTEWKATQHGHGGQPHARVENGTFTAGVRAPWGGNPGQKTCAVTFIAPKSGIYVVTGTARIKPWEGGAKKFKLGVFKKDTQRAAPVQTLELPRDNSPVPFEIRVELTAGHELVFLPLIPDYHNAGTVKIEDLTVTLKGE